MNNYLTKYNTKFYKANQKNAKAAKRLARLCIRLTKPKSVIDVGCATGLFLKEFHSLGVERIFGVDGEWVDKDLLLISRNNFMSADLSKKIPRINERFDLAMCLETAEHLEKRHEKRLVGFLTRLSEVVIFGAAIPFQRGVHHVNEQWQSHWAKIFGDHGYEPIDCIRPSIWYDNMIPPAYRQNTFLYVKKSNRLYLKLRKKYPNIFMSDIIHPDYFLSRADPRLTPYQNVLKGLYFVPIRGVKLLLKKTHFNN